MKLGDIWIRSLESVTKTTEVVRQLCFAGLGMIWLLHQEVSAPFGSLLLLSSFSFITCITLDLLQHVVTTLKWRGLAKKEELKLTKVDVSNADQLSADVSIPDGFHSIPARLFWTKIVFVILASGLLFDARNAWRSCRLPRTSCVASSRHVRRPHQRLLRAALVRQTSARRCAADGLA